jgi:parallel beta-helix repeat protein
MHSSHKFTISCLASVALVALSGQAYAKTVIVGTCVAGTQYPTIQAAVTASAAATIIEVCPGIYPEQVVITKKLTVEGISSGGQDAAVIVPPASGLVQNTTDFDNGSFPVAAQVLVQNIPSALVTISNLTVDGTGNLVSTCDLDLIGIMYQNASGTINHVATRNQEPVSGYGACQIGQGIFVETSTGSSKVTIENVSVHNYNKNGITGNDAGTTLTLTGNFIQGNGLVACSADEQGAAQNGIELGYGATGTILNTTVIDNLYNYDPTVPNGTCYYDSADILLIDTAENSGIKIQHDSLGNSQIPLGLFTDTEDEGDGVSVTGNSIYGTATFDGIDVCTNGNTITGNTIVNSAESGVHLDASCGSSGLDNTVTGNTFVESACAGILDDTGGSGGNSYGTDTYYTVPYTVTYSAGSCPFVPAENSQVAHAKVRALHKFSPKR